MRGRSFLFDWLCWSWAATLALQPTRALARLEVEASESRVLGMGNSAATAGLLSCAGDECAAFYVDSRAGCRVRAVRLEASGAPVEATRTSIGVNGCSLYVTAAGDDYAIAYSDPEAPSGQRVLLVDGEDFQVVAELSSERVGRGVRGIYSDGKTVLLVDYTLDDVATLIDLESGELIDSVPIADFWEPVVLAGVDQYLLFYPDRGYARRLSSLSGEWLDATGLALTPVSPATRVASEGSGYFRDGVYQLAWRYATPPPGTEAANVFGARIDARDGTRLDMSGNSPLPQLLCASCPTALEGTFQLGAANYFWFGRAGDAHPLLEIDPLTGGRKNGAAHGPDVTFPTLHPITQVAPPTGPKLVSAAGAVHAANGDDLSQFVAPEPHLPGRSASLAPSSLVAASNGDSFAVVFQAEARAHVRLVSPRPRAPVSPLPSLTIESVRERELALETALGVKVASAGGKYLFASTHVDDDGGVQLQWQTLDDNDGTLGPLVVESTGKRVEGGSNAWLELGSDGEQYLLALFVGSVIDSDGSIWSRRISADGEALEPLGEIVTGVGLLDGVFAHRKAPPATTRFAVSYRKGLAQSFASFVQPLLPSGLIEGEPISVGEYGYVLVSDELGLLARGGRVDLVSRAVIPLDVPAEHFDGLSHWDGNAYVSLGTLGRTLLATHRSPVTLSADGPGTSLTEQLVDYSPVSTSDGQGRSLVAYFSAEEPDSFTQLRGVLLETSVSDGGAGAESGAGGADAGGGGIGLGGTSVSVAGQPSAGEGGAAGVYVMSEAGTHDASGGQPVDQGATSGALRTSKGCGCTLRDAHAGSASAGACIVLFILAICRRPGRARSRRAHAR